MFSLATDGSNDMEDQKLYPAVVRYFSPSLKQVVTVLLALLPCILSSTGENIFKLMHEELSQNGLQWQKVISFATDNASVMTGKVKGVSAYIHKQNETVYISGCQCHLLHIAAQKGCAALGVPVEELESKNFSF